MNFAAEKPKKRLFIELISGSYIVMLLSFWAAWYIAFPGLSNINEYLPYIFAIVLCVVLFLMGFGIVGMVFGILGWPLPSIFKRQTYYLLNMLFYVVLGTGRVLGIDRRKIESSFVAVSNAIVANRHIRVPADRLLVVTPHCLQLATCPHKITRDPNNCKRCGRCNIGSLVTMAEEIGFHFFVVTGGTLARQMVKNIRPKAVVAIACERDLTSGIQDVYPLPTMGIMNIRPNGPCFNTKVDIDEFRKVIEAVIEPPDKDKEDKEN
ncbi:DUF116 domain-containing protein [Anaerovibrio sp.]|uniref:DUF116 domain-containing protein n=1 Tax=Anaerovibrio sp. TaxID=1872532 RepID=UPI0025C2222C|nr:DUF116 domain-containing protein [Anaerovibrio sp.]MBR2142844.1 DUF116 domain-containing protein [Anaerovibrio sp.]